MKSSDIEQLAHELISQIKSDVVYADKAIKCAHSTLDFYQWLRSKYKHAENEMITIQEVYEAFCEIVELINE